MILSIYKWNIYSPNVSLALNTLERWAMAPFRMKTLLPSHSPGASKKCSIPEIGSLCTLNGTGVGLSTFWSHQCFTWRHVCWKRFSVQAESPSRGSNGSSKSCCRWENPTPGARLKSSSWGNAGARNSVEAQWCSAWKPWSLLKENVHSGAFLSTTVMSSLDEAMLSVKIG